MTNNHPDQIDTASNSRRIYTLVDPLKRFTDKVEILGSGCWQWTGSLATGGYANFNIRGTTFLAHRFSYWLFKGEIPRELQLDHLCRNRGCVNPDHLEAVTPRENVLRGEGVTAVFSKKTHCTKGHEFTPNNTLTTARGGRACRACRNDYARRNSRRIRLMYIPMKLHYRNSCGASKADQDKRLWTDDISKVTCQHCLKFYRIKNLEGEMKEIQGTEGLNHG